MKTPYHDRSVTAVSSSVGEGNARNTLWSPQSNMKRNIYIATLAVVACSGLLLATLGGREMYDQTTRAAFKFEKKALIDEERKIPYRLRDVDGVAPPGKGALQPQGDYFFELQQQQVGKCLSTPKDHKAVEGSELFLGLCAGVYTQRNGEETQTFSYSFKDNTIRHRQSGLCLSTVPDGTVNLQRCSTSLEAKWRVNSLPLPAPSSQRPLISVSSIALEGQCLRVPVTAEDSNPTARLLNCTTEQVDNWRMVTGGGSVSQYTMLSLYQDERQMVAPINDKIVVQDEILFKERLSPDEPEFASRLWTFGANGMLINKQSQQCLRGDAVNGVYLDDCLQSYSTSTGMNWYIGDGDEMIGYTIIHALDGFCLTTPTMSANDATLSLKPCSSQTSIDSLQRWSAVHLPTQFRLRSRISEYCVGPKGSPDNGAKLEISKCDQDDQFWSTGSSRQLVHASTRKCVDVPGVISEGNIKNGAELQLWDCDGDGGEYTTDQTFWPRGTNAFGFQFITAYTQRHCIDVWGAPAMNEGDSVKLYWCDNLPQDRAISDQAFDYLLDLEI